MLGPRRLIALLLAFAAASAFPSCAKDVGVDGNPSSGGSAGSGTEGGAGSGGGSGDGGWPIGGFGAPCSQDAMCDSMQCTDIGNAVPNQVCTTTCGAGQACPAGGYCAFHPEHGYLCIPDTGNQCAVCVTDTDCPNVGDRCTISPKFDRFCARDCSYDGLCPGGFTCVSVDGYPPGVSGGSDGGVADAGSGEAGGPTKPLRMCVPDNDESCPCNSKRDGVKRKCQQQSGSLVCEGTETCNGQKGSWEGCTAGSPQPEVCDGADNDCNGTPDDGSPEDMCASQGTPVHATWDCNLGACVIAQCDPGYAHYPPTLPQSSGCPCAIGSQEPNDTCATATPAGSVTDGNTTALTISGRLHSDNDEDWYSFDTVDADEGTTNSYHIRIVFSSPASNNEFVFDVIRGDTCATPDANHSGLTEYDWCVDGQGTVAGKTIGEKVCGPSDPIHCGPHTKKYLLRVKRKAGVAGTCAEYKLTVTAKGSGNCDFTKACDPQVSEI